MAADTAEVKALKKKRMVERKAADKKCKMLIIAAIADSQLELVKDCSTPKRIWTTLKNVFERCGVAGQLFIRKQLLTLKYVEGASDGLAEHLLKFDRLIRELKESGAAVEESDAICHLLLTLPSSFDSVVTAIETLPGGVTMSFVKKRLMDVDLKNRNVFDLDGNVDDAVKDVAMVSTNARRKIKCFRCGKIGHKIKDCRMPETPSEVRYRNSKTGPSNEDSSSSDRSAVAFVASEEKELVKMKWILDSGASDHMVNDSSFFGEMRRLERPVEVIVANGDKLTAEFCGDVVLYAVVGSKMKKCEAKNVLYFPGLDSNLFSVQRVARSGLRVSFVGNRAEIKKNGEVMAIGHNHGRLYELDVFCVRREKEVAVKTQKVTEEAVVWHQHSGYIGRNNFKQTTSHELVKNYEDQTVKKKTVQRKDLDEEQRKRKDFGRRQAEVRPPEEKGEAAGGGHRPEGDGGRRSSCGREDPEVCLTAVLRGMAW